MFTAAKEKDAAPYQQITIRNSPWTYLHLCLLSSVPTPSSNLPGIDILTARTHLTAALQQFLGVTGTTIPVDFLKVEGRDVWVRVPRDDGSAIVAALGSWVGTEGGGVSWRVKGRGDWLASIVGGNGKELFEG